MLEKYFNYKKHKTDFKTEVIAGVTTFLTMAYIMFLNPFILSGEFAGPEKGFFDFGAVYTATIVAVKTAPKSKKPFSGPANSPDNINGFKNII